MNPRFSSDEVVALYEDRDAEQLIDVYSRIAAAPSVRRQWEERLDMFDGLRPSRGRMLDFGCGYGGFLELAQGRGWDAHGSELGQWAGVAAGARGLKNVHVGLLSSIGFEPESFDLIHSAQVFEHLPQPKGELLELRNLLTPGGLLYVDVPNYRSLTIRLNRDDFLLNEPPQHVNYFSPAGLTRLLNDAGLQVISVTTFGGLKWENVLGRSTHSDIKAAYEAGPQVKPASEPARPAQGRSQAQGRFDFKRSLKSVVLATFVRPVLYKRLKLGMGLAVIARKP